jgi:hypothetical protein
MAGMFLTQDQVKEVGKISNRCALSMRLFATQRYQTELGPSAWTWKCWCLRQKPSAQREGGSILLPINWEPAGVHDI